MLDDNYIPAWRNSTCIELEKSEAKLNRKRRKPLRESRIVPYGASSVSRDKRIKIKKSQPIQHCKVLSIMKFTFLQVFREQIWTGMLENTLFTTKRNCTRLLNHAMKRTLKDYAYSHIKRRNIPNESIRTTWTPFAYHTVNPMHSTSVVSKHIFISKRSTRSAQKLTRQRQYFSKQFHFFREENNIEIDSLKLKHPNK